MDLREFDKGSVEWIQLAQDRDRWRAVVNTVMNLRVLVPRISYFHCFVCCGFRTEYMTVYFLVNVVPELLSLILHTVFLVLLFLC
jgi:hypothetical protein